MLSHTKKNRYLAIAALAVVILTGVSMYKNVNLMMTFGESLPDKAVFAAQAIGFTLLALSIGLIIYMLIQSRANILVALAIMVAVFLYAYEVHGTSGYDANMNEQYAKNSDYNQAKQQRLEITKQQIANLSAAKVALEQAANSYSPALISKKVTALAVAEGMNSELNGLLEKQSSQLSTLTENGYQTARPIYKSWSNFLYENETHSKTLQDSVHSIINLCHVAIIMIVPIFLWKVSDKQPETQKTQDAQNHYNPIKRTWQASPFDEAERSPITASATTETPKNPFSVGVSENVSSQPVQEKDAYQESNIGFIPSPAVSKNVLKTDVRFQTETATGNRNGKSVSSLKGFEDLKTAIENGEFFTNQNTNKVGVRSIMRFMKCGEPKANDFLTELKAKNIKLDK